MMRGHHQMRQQCLRRLLALDLRELADDAVRAHPAQQFKLRAARMLRSAVGQIDDLSLYRAVDRAVRFIDEACKILRMPMVAPGLSLVAVHALLNDRPFAVVGDKEAMKVEIESVLHRGAVDLGHETTRACQFLAVETDALAEQPEFIGCLPGMLPPAATDVNAKFALERSKTALQGADDAGGDAGGMPVHSHHGAERLKPERMRQPLQELVTPVVVDDGLADDGAERSHALAQPWRNASAMKGEIRAAAPSCHACSIRLLCQLTRTAGSIQQ